MATIRGRSSLRRRVRFRSSATSSARDGKSVTVTRGPTFRNRVSLAPNLLETLAKQYAGTRLERQELNAEFIHDGAGAPRTCRIYDLCRLAFARPLLPTQRIVVAIDPGAKASNEKDRTSETGSVVAGLGRDERGHGLEVLSCRLLPRGWTCKAIAARGRYEPDALAVEINTIGAMVEAVLRAERAGLPLRQVRANRGKTTRAEPIAALQEQSRVSHAPHSRRWRIWCASPNDGCPSRSLGPPNAWMPHLSIPSLPPERKRQISRTPWSVAAIAELSFLVSMISLSPTLRMVTSSLANSNSSGMQTNWSSLSHCSLTWHSIERGLHQRAKSANEAPLHKIDIV